MRKLAIDFGTSNTVIAQWNDEQNRAEVVALPGLTAEPAADRPAFSPSLLYLHNGGTGEATIGQAVRDQNLDRRQDNRLFRNFKRGIVASTATEPRMVDDSPWGDRDVGRPYLRQILKALSYAQTDELVLTAPVISFEGYLTWLNETVGETETERDVRVVDESTAAALGYSVTEAGGLVLVFDFGGGTLDLSLVQLPDSREKTGGFLRRLLLGNSQQHTARVIAKTGRILGGSDIDQWLVADVLRRTGLSSLDLGTGYAPLVTACEAAKIALSTLQQTDITFEAAGRTYQLTITRTELESLLEQNGFFRTLRYMIDKVMHVGHQRGIFREDLRYVLMVGGTSLMPSVQSLLGKYFGETAVRTDKPFTAIAEGALQLAAGLGLEDHLVHSYAIRYLDPETQIHQYDEIIPMGTRYPLDKPIEVLLGAAYDQQQAMEFVIGEIDTESASLLELKYVDGQAVFVAQGIGSGRQIVPLNESAATLAELLPPGLLHKERLRAAFTINADRQLLLSVYDLDLHKLLLSEIVVASIR